jgi:hypothetical protein
MAGADEPWQTSGVSVRAITIALAFGMATCVAASAGTTPGAADNTSVPQGGIWKAVVPLKPMKGEFGNLDPIGVAAGARILADCSINWVNPDDGARYCFSSGTSLEFFLDRPHYNIERARAGWRKLNAQH